jgi:hypothetical protein
MLLDLNSGPALFRAVRYGWVSRVKKILSDGVVDARAVDENGATAYEVALENGFHGIAALILECGAGGGEAGTNDEFLFEDFLEYYDDTTFSAAESSTPG